MKTDNLRTVKLSEIIDLPIHPVANILPLLEKSVGDESKKNTVTLAELADNIRKNGLQEPIVLFAASGSDNTTILDGRNRRLACQMAAKTDKIDLDDYEVQVLDFIGTEGEADEFVFVKGLNRRDLTASQRAISAAMFEYDCPEAFSRMKERAKLKMLATQNNEAGRSLTKNGQADEDEIAHVNLMLADAFHVSKGYVIDARRKLREERKARTEAERHAVRAAELEELARQTALEVEEAKAEGDSAKVWEVAQNQNQTIIAAAEEREKAAELTQQASARATEIKKIHQKQANLRQAPKETKSQSDDPIKQLRTSINSSITNLKKSVSELAQTSGQGVDDFNFVGRKISEVVEHFESEFGRKASEFED